MMMLNATFGNDSTFLKIGSRKLRCYVLDNDDRVFAREEIQKTLGYAGSSKEWLRDFLLHINRLMTVPPDILEMIELAPSFAVDQLNGTVTRHALSPEVFLRICAVIVKAKDIGYLYQSELKHAKAAAEILAFFKERPAIAIIDFVSGFESYKINLKLFLTDKIRLALPIPVSQWVKSVPDEFFDLLFLLKNGSWKDIQTDSGWFAQQLINLVFARISTTDLETLMSSKPKMKYKSEFATEKYLPTLALQEHLFTLRRLYDLALEEELSFLELVEKYLPVQNEQLTRISDRTNKNPKLEDIRAALEIALKSR